MKEIHAPGSGCPSRPFFEPGEIDQLCVTELRKFNLLPGTPQAVRIERFIEKRFGVSPSYEDGLPPGVLGYTAFGKDGVDQIVVARSLAEEDSPTTQRRVRATLAHEAGHGLLHAHLFALEGMSGKLFDADAASGQKVLCREVPMSGGHSGRLKTSWSEFQANTAIGGLLLPRHLVEAALAEFRVDAGVFAGFVIDPSRWADAVSHLAEIFDVNPIVARIRLDTLYGSQKSGQLTL